MFGGGYVEEAPIIYDNDLPKVTFGTNADWKTEAGMARPNNGITTQNAYKEKQKHLSSQVFEQTDYQGYAPLAKTFTSVQNDDPSVSPVPVSKGRKVNEAFKEGVQQ